MGRMTTAMWWSGLILLFASGLLFGLAVAQAEADTTCFIQAGSAGWETTARVILPNGRAIYRQDYIVRPEDRSDCDRVQALEQARSALEAAAVPAPPVAPPDVMRTAIERACAKYYPTDRVLYGRCLVQATGGR
jgi:hypothetical protein